MNCIQTIPGDSNFEKFTQFPLDLYIQHPQRKNHPERIAEHHLHHACIVENQGKVLARAAIYVNPQLTYQGYTSCCVGHYECVEDDFVASFFWKELFNQIQAMNVEYIIGPMNGSTWEDYRFSLSHEHPNFLLEPYHFIYYNQQWKNAGFTEISSYYSSLDQDMPCDWDEILQLEQDFEKRGVFVRSIDVNNYESELKKLYPLVLQGFQRNFLYTPIPWEAFYEKYTSAKSLIDPGFVYIAETTEGQAVGFIFSYRDLLDTTKKSLIVKTIARNPDKAYAGLGHVIGNKIIREANVRKFDTSKHVFLIEQATSKDLSANFMAKPYKKYALYGKKI